MVRKTLSKIRTEVASIASQAGLAVTDSRLTEIINYATETLMSRGNWPQVIERVRFSNYGGWIALPLEYEVALRFTIQNNQTPIANHWYEFLSFGPGRQDNNTNSTNYGWTGIPTPRGESPVIRQPDTTDTGDGQVIRAYGFVDEREGGVRPEIRILGYDADNRWVRSFESGVWVDGEALEINGDTGPTYATSTTLWSKITGVVKPVTRGSVELFYVDSAAATHFAARYFHRDTIPMYRIYWCPGVVAEDEFMAVHALCRRRFVPASDDNDLCIITNTRAMRAAVSAAAKEKAQQWEEAEALWNVATNELKIEADAWYGDTMALIDFAPETGFGEPNPVW